MEDKDTKAQVSADPAKQRKYDYIPLNPQLITLVRSLSGLDEEQLQELRTLLTQLARKMNPNFSFEDADCVQDPVVKSFLSVTLRLHQVFALVDVDYAKAFGVSQTDRTANIAEHFKDVAAQLNANSGLAYGLAYTRAGAETPAQQKEGRAGCHAADSSVLISHLAALKSNVSQVSSSVGYTYFIRLAQAQGDKADGEDLSQYDKQIFTELEISETNIILDIEKAFVNLSFKANGKADLYFHAYFWQQYLQSLNTLYASALDTSVPTFTEANYPFMARLVGLSATLSKVIVNIKKFPFSEKSYRKYVQEFGAMGNQLQSAKKLKYLEEIQRALFVAQIADDTVGMHWIERLLIQLQGYADITVRDQAIVLLNMLYDGLDWQLQEAFRPVVRCVGQHFVVKAIVQRTPQQREAPVFLALAAPSNIDGNNHHLLTWHQLAPSNMQASENGPGQEEIAINFGKFWKCGFYDWRLVSVSEAGKLDPLAIISIPDPQFPSRRKQAYDDYYAEEEEQLGTVAQGRFVVHAKGVKDLSFHEVQLDYQNAEVDKTTNTFAKRGTFLDVQNAIPGYARQGVDALYLMGALERDNLASKNKYSGDLEFKREDASALAAVDRGAVNKMLGGEAGLTGVVQAAKKAKVKIIIDSLARISSSRHHRKYKDLLLRYLDEGGRVHVAYGTDGQAQRFEDTCMLNYRKIEAWDLLIDEVMSLVGKFGVDGIHLDNGQAWPQIMEPDLEELERHDLDGEPLYTPEDLMNGEVVIRNENFGYWNSNNMETYPNPFFVKLCKRLWLENPNFLIIGECWGGYMFEHRQIILARSGVIPRLYKLPIAISSLFGKKLHKDGQIEQQAPEDVVEIKRWWEDTRRYLPDGTIQLQSSTAHTLPYPAFLYGKGAWAAIDILMFMPDIPITFNGELDGDVFKVGQQQAIFQQEQANVTASSSHAQLKRTNSAIMRALAETADPSEPVKAKQLSPRFTGAKPSQLPDAGGATKLDSGTSYKTASGLLSIPGHQLTGAAKTASGISDAVAGGSTGSPVSVREERFKQESQLLPHKGFDLNLINTHYQNRRAIRKQKMVLRYGDFIQCGARDQSGTALTDVLVYARYSLMETIIVSTSLCDRTVRFCLDLGNLLDVYRKAYPNNTVVMVRNIINDSSDPEYYFLREFIELRSLKVLPAYRSILLSITICEDDQFIFKKCLTTSIERTKKNLLAGRSIETEQVSLLFSDCIENNPTDIPRFANVIGSIQNSFLDKLGVNFRQLFTTNSKLSQSPEMSARLMSMTGYLLKQAEGQTCAPVRAAQALHESNALGPIVFFTPELGRWSTVGGLGVMVDELSIGVAALGQEVIVVSPYYERNRKGQTGYLAKDPAGIHYKDNITVDINGGTVLGVHEGVVDGVKVVFLHNGDIFPSPYPDAQPAFTVQQLAVFGKGCLEYCCSRKCIPSVAVTNDWFTGFTAAYAKIGHYGDTFKGTTFIHICHNLNEAYEGRIHLNHGDGDLGALHKLPRDWLIDPKWRGNVINPSRCAIMLSDQWSTVSRSYRDEILKESALAELLRQKPQPFAHPNGIPIAERVRKLDAVAPDHLTAKAGLQKKYFNLPELDDSVPLFAFVGRVTTQKGVHLILDIAERIILKSNHKVQFLVGGPANMREPYAADCAHKMWHLKAKYPACFWAAPEEFFTDGALVNRGADFGLMPSAFEPGGIVQHEFFVGCTPVVAFKTGGLKDSVLEYMWATEEGSGFTFESYTADDFIFAMERALGTFRNKHQYNKLRENAFKATMPGEVVCKAWLNEFYRLKGKVFTDYTHVKAIEKNFMSWRPQDYTPISIIQEIFGADKKRETFEEIDHGATEAEDSYLNDSMLELDVITSAFDKAAFSKQPQIFQLHNRGPRHRQVQICGSFDDWKVRHDMNFDPFTNQWFITLHVKAGEEFLYKYIVNGDTWVVNDEEPKRKDADGNVNNFGGFLG